MADNLLQTSIQRQKPVPEVAGISYVGVVSVRKIGKEPVYNMEAEGNHNFAVNGGLIVHNCMDAMRYFVNTMDITRLKREHKPVIFGVTQ